MTVDTFHTILLLILFILNVFGWLFMYSLGFRNGANYVAKEIQKTLAIVEAKLKLDPNYLKKVDIQESTQDSIKQYKIEVHNDIMYLFDKKTDIFLCQGKTVTELTDKLNKLDVKNAQIIGIDNEVLTHTNIAEKKNQNL